MTCDGPAKTFTITVNPAADLLQPASQVKCNGTATDVVTFTTANTGGTVTYTWTNDEPSIGLAAGGTGDIASFTAINAGTAPIVATIVVTPHFENGSVTCDGPAKTFTITVNPAADLLQPASQVKCNGTATDVVTFTTANTGGTVTYTWTNDEPSIGLAAGGTGDIASFTAINAGTAPIVATIVVTPHFENGSVTCDGPAKTFTITVNPAADVHQPGSQVKCNGTATDVVTFTTANTGGTVTYTWTNDEPSIGLAAGGTGDIASFTAINAGTAPIVATIVVTPHFENGSVTCDGPAKTFTITVNPAADLLQPASQVKCNGTATDVVTFTTANTGGTVTYTWTNDEPSIGLAAGGTGDIASFTAINAGTAPIVATIVVTPHFENGSVTCDGPAKTFTITVNPAADLLQPASQVKCNGTATDVVTFTTANTGGTVTYTWTNDEPSIGLAAGGTGDIASFTAINAGTAPIVATIVVTPHFENGSVTCDGPAKTFTITVNPAADLIQPASQVKCNGTATDVVTFTTANTGGTVTYTWTNDEPSIGLAAGGTGDIASFTAINAGTAPIVATIVVTPHFENGSVTCDGPAKTFTITVNPAADLLQPASQVKCNGTATDVVTFTTANTGGTVTYTWTNDEPSIGLAAGGTGDIASFTAINAGTAPIVATIVVTPHFENGSVTCDGPAKTFTITVNPAADLLQPASQVKCNGTATDVVTFTTANTGGTVTYTWTNDEPSIGLAAGGTGDIASFTAINAGTAPIVATIVVTPHFENGSVTCDGPAKTFTITVNPAADLLQPASQVKCNGTATDVVTFTTANTGGTVTYTWTNDEPSIGLAAGGTGDIASFTAINAGTAPIVATIVVTPHFENGSVTCDGPAKTFTITVNPAADVLQPASQVKCNGTATDVVTFTTANTGGTVTYTWTNDEPSIGLAAGGTGDIASFTAINAGTAPIVATIVVTPHFENGSVTCDGPAKTFTITVNPAADLLQPASQVKCNGTATDVVTFTTANTGGTVTYTWTNDEPSIGLAAGGTGDIASFTAINAGTAPIVATIVVTPHFENGSVTCDGPAKTFTITVNPAADLLQPASQVKCNGTATDVVTFTTANTGGTVTYTWTNDEPSIGLAAGGTGDIASFTAINAGTAPIVATIVVTPHFENGSVTCDGPAKTFTITVNPAADLLQPASQVKCNGTATDVVTFTTANTGGTVTYTWTNDEPSIGLAAGGTGDIASFTAINAGTAPIVATIVVTPHFENGSVTCDGPAKTFTITVNPAADVIQPASQVKCNGTATDVVTFTTANTGGTVTYTWTNDEPSIGLAAGGTGDIASFTAINAGTAPIVATIVVTPHFENGSVTCDGPAKTFTITVNPAADLLQPASQVKCNGTATDVVTFTTANTGGTVTYTWTNDEPSIGLAAGGTGDIASFTAINAGTAPIVATIVVTPHFENGSVTCDGPAKTFTITVNPAAQVDLPVNQVVCNDSPTLPVIFTTINNGGLTTYTWTNDLPSIGLAAGGAGDILSFTAINTGNSPVIATIVVTPHFENGSVTCDGPSKTFTITVDPTPQVVPSILTQTICNNGVTNIVIGSPSTFSSGVVTFNYTVVATGGVTGFLTPANGLPKGFIIADILFNPTNEIQTVTYTIVPVTSTGCASGPATVIVKVLPTAQVDQPAEQVLCNDGDSAPVTFGTLTVGTVAFTWTNDQPSIGLPASGSGNIPSFSAVNTGDSPVIATISVTPHFIIGALSCQGQPKTFTVTVNPTPRIYPEPSDLIQCDNTATGITLQSPSTFTSGVVTFKYTATGTGGVTGYTASATGLLNNHVITDVLVNPTDDPQTVTYTITPVSPGGCSDGPSVDITVTVNPTPRIYPEPSDLIQCDNTATGITLQSPSTFTSGVVTFKYTATGTGGVTGYTASATGLLNNHVITDVLVNPTDDPQTVTYTITPVSPGGCSDGPSVDITVTVNPTPRIYPEPSDLIQCDNTATGITLQSPSTFTSGVVTFKYTATGTGGVTGYTASATGLLNNHVITDVLVNPTDDPQTVTYTITPVSPGGCSDGPSVDITVTVNPTPRIYPEPSDLIQCDNTATGITLQSPSTFTSGVVTFKYTATGTGGVTGYTASATGLLNNHVITDVLVNPTDDPQTVTYTITPVSPGGCSDGPSVDITVTVNPTPRIYPEPSDLIQCDNTATGITLQSPSTFTSGVVTFKYTATGTGGVTGYTASATGLLNNHVITDVLVNPTDDPQTVTYTITPVSPGGCSDGPSVDITVTVNPTPRIYPEPSDLIQCDNTATGITLQSPSTFTSGVVTFKYTATGTGGVTGYTASATGLLNNHVITDVLVNPTDDPQTVTYTITPVSPGGCSDGPSVDITVTVNPTPRAMPVNSKPEICFGENIQITLNSPTSMTSGEIRFDYTISVPAGVNGNSNPANDRLVGDILAFSYSNYNDTVQSVFFTITPKVTGLNCPAGNINIQEVQLHPIPARGITITKPFTCEAGTGRAALEAEISRGAAPYDLLWKGPVGYTMEDSLEITNLYAGNYTLYAEDNIGCKGETSIFINNQSASARIIPIPLLPNIHVSCPGGNDGSARVYVRDGITDPYDYWVVFNDIDIVASGTFTGNYDVGNPSTYRLCTGLVAGEYKVIIRDLNGCETYRTTELKDPEPFEVSFAISDYAGSHISCRGYNDGSAEATVTGGNGSYIYLWYPATGSLAVSTNSSRLDSIPAGKYYLRITDLMGCVKIDSVTLLDPPGMILSGSEVSHSNDNNYEISCQGASDGFIRIDYFRRLRQLHIFMGRP